MTEYVIAGAVVAGLLVVPQVERVGYSLFMDALFFVANPDWDTKFDKWDVFG